jgi:hypothetical protein
MSASEGKRAKGFTLRKAIPLTGTVHKLFQPGASGRAKIFRGTQEAQSIPVQCGKPGDASLEPMEKTGRFPASLTPPRIYCLYCYIYSVSCITIGVSSSN